MSTAGLEDNMEYSISTIRNQLQIYEDELEDDNNIFNEKLNLTRKNLFDHINQLIQDLNDIKRHYEFEFDYLEDENKKTCDDNKQRFKDLCISINKYENDQEKIFKIFNNFKETFPMRPNMLKNIPEFHLQDIHIDSFIKKNDESISTTNHINERCFKNCDSFSTVTKIDHGSSPIIFNKADQSLKQNSNYIQPQNEKPRSLSSSFRSQISSKAESSFVPITSIINNDAQIPSTSSKITESIGHSHHKQFSSQNNPTTIMTEPQSRSVSTINGSKNIVDILFQYPYESNRNIQLMAYNIHENSLLIYSLNSDKLEYLIIKTGEIKSIYLPSNELLLNLGYSSNHHCFYLISKQTHQFILFHLNEQEICIEQQFELIDEKQKINSLITGHIYENTLFFLYNLSSEIIMFGKYNFHTSTFISSINLKNIVYDDTEEFSYEIIDFSVNISYITFLIQLKNFNRYMLIIHDHDINQIFSFDLIDAKQPLSIISTTIRTSQSVASAISNEEIQLLLFINDPKSHVIHCCTHERYLISIEINSFGICSLNYGNLALVANKDIRGLKVQDYLKRKHVQFC